MIVIRDPNELSKINDTALREFIRQYFLSLCEPEYYDPDEHGFFVVIEPGESAEQVETRTGYSVLVNDLEKTVYGEPGFTPEFTAMIDHGAFYEAPIIFNDGGYAIVMLIIKGEAMDSKLLKLCTEFAIPAA
jgi:hypothetical protein